MTDNLDEDKTSEKVETINRFSWACPKITEYRIDKQVRLL